MVSTVLRIPDELIARIKATAKKNNRSMNGEILQAIEIYLQTQEKPPEPINFKQSWLNKQVANVLAAHWRL